MSRLFKAHRSKPPAKAPTPVVSETTGRSGKTAAAAKKRADDAPASAGPKEVGGPEGPEPTRYGDWERKGICVDF